MQVSIVVPTFNRRELVCRAAQRLFGQHFPSGEYEIVFVVDGSTDGTAQALRRLQGPCRVRVVEQENKGLAAARNTGLEAARGETVIFLDDDMLCDPELIQAHASGHEPNKSTVGFGAIFLSPDSPRSLAAECFNRELGAFYLRQREVPDTPWPASACVFSNTSVRRAVLLASGGFDSRFRMREDAELGVRLFAAGMVPRYLPEAIAWQFYNKTARDLIRDAEAFAAADSLFLRSYPGRTNQSFLGRIATEPVIKRLFRRAAVACPVLGDALLTPVSALAELFFDVAALRKTGIRALQIRQRIHWYHHMYKLNCVPEIRSWASPVVGSRP